MVAAWLPAAVADRGLGCRCRRDRDAADRKQAASRPTSASPRSRARRPIDKAKGCIYLGIDLRPHRRARSRPSAVPITDAQKAFWKRVNKPGGIGGYEIDVTTYVRDNKYNPQIAQPGLPGDQGQDPGPGADPGLADHRGDPARPEGQQHRGRAGRRGRRCGRSRTTSSSPARTTASSR